ncbi:MAG TPA: indole-3-glycerol phosphate synthase TrpC [Planctomycetota bacterium]
MKTGTRLDAILEDVRRRAAARRGARTLGDLRAAARPDPAKRARFLQALAGPELGVIAECKRRSPSAGMLDEQADLLPRARAYAEGGANALSVLTESDHFHGAPADLERVEAAGLPRLRKDFLLDEGMLLESAAMACEAVLLLAVCLPGGMLGEMRALAGELGLAVLMEVHDEAELARAMDTSPDLLGVNARDLRTFEVDLATVERLLPLAPAGPRKVAESGIRTRADVMRVRAAGADAVLVGEALMRAGDPAGTLRAWRAGESGK